MDTWYRVGYGMIIDEERVLRETEHYLISPDVNYRGNHYRMQKRDYFRTREEAIDWLVKHGDARILSAQKELDRAIEYRERVRENYGR